MRPPSVPTTIPINIREDSRQVVMMKSLYNALIEYRDPKTHRIPIQLFMCLPSRKDFPEYFNIISKPIAMNRIRERIERHQYQDVESCLEDFKLMFRNCKVFNEDDSQIYNDAVFLEGILIEKKERLSNEEGRPSRDSKAAAREAILNSTTNNSSGNHNTNLSTSTRVDRHSSNNHVNSNDDSQSCGTRSNDSNYNSSTKNHSKYENITNNGNQQEVNNQNSIPNKITSTPVKDSATVNSINNNGNSNGADISNDDTSTMQSDSTNHSKTNQLNGKDDLDVSLNITHDHLNETSMDSSSNLSTDILNSTPVEKCSLNTRRGRNPDAPKRQLLTGYIIYASEVRKDVIDRNPNQNFGDISRLVGNEWKALPHDIKLKYHQRALTHNDRVRQRAQREMLNASSDGQLPNGLHTPKLTKRKLAKLAKEQMRQYHLSAGSHDDSSTQSSKPGQEHPSSNISQTPNSSTYKHTHQQHLATQLSAQSSSGKSINVDSSTQTTAMRFVEPPTKKRLVYSESFRKYIESLQVPNRDLLAEETAPERPPELPKHWLGAGIGRHESPEAALWALRDFMLQDAVTMRRNMEPYL